MTTRLVNWLFLTGFVLVAMVYLYQSFGIAAANPAAGYGPVQFPIVLGVSLIILCLAEAVVSARWKDPEEDAPLTVPNGGKLLITVVLTGLYFLGWEMTGQFYLLTGFFYFLLAVFYQEQRSARSLVTAALIAVLFTLSLYLIFGLAFRIQLV